MNKSGIEGDIAKGNLQAVKDWFADDKHSNIDQNIGGNTALYLAALYNQPLILKYLLEQGANVNATSNDLRRSAAHIAAQSPNPECLNIL